MTTNELQDYLIKFLALPRVKTLCQSYHAETEEVLGELYLQLSHQRPKKTIKTLSAWFMASAMGHLRNYLNRWHTFRP